MKVYKEANKAFGKYTPSTVAGISFFKTIAVGRTKTL
jgi:hypothetical protein